ncbi:MAG: FAD-dependent oxidoreductase [Cyanobacteria bacterium J06598_1]
MSVEYDLVVLGGTLEGRLAAKSAASYGARVALIEPPGVFAQRQQSRYLLKGLQQLAEGKAGQSVGEWFWKSPAKGSDEASVEAENAAKFDWSALVAWSAIASETQSLNLSVDTLSMSGVDFIAEMPKRLSPQLVVRTANRTLSTRSVLAAFGTVPSAKQRADKGLSVSAVAGPMVTGAESLLQLKTLPAEVTILGESFEAVDWAEALNGLGVAVTLVAEQFLPDEDSDIRGWVQSQLLTTGIKLASAFTPSFSLSPSIVLNLTHQPALVLPAFVYPPASRSQSNPYLLPNNRLQTAHPRIFACRYSPQGGVGCEAAVQQEAQVAVLNALFLPTRRVQYREIPQSYHRFAKVGPTPRFARMGHQPPHGYDVRIAVSHNSATLHRVSPLASYCKLIFEYGELQIIQLLGEGASDLVEPLATLIDCPISDLLGVVENWPVQAGSESLMDLVREAAESGVRSRWHPDHWRRDWAENWFNWRRSR